MKLFIFLRKLFWLFIVLAMNSHFGFSQSNYFVEGTLSKDTIWEADTVKITGDIAVENGATLTIKPGVVVEFQGYYGMKVKGRLLAAGIPGDSIYFTASDTATGWSGVLFNQTPEENDTSVFKCCTFRYRKPTDESGQRGGAIKIYDFSKVIIRHSRFSNNSGIQGAAIFLSMANVNIEHCKIINNRAYKIPLEGNTEGIAIFCANSTLHIKNNMISGNNDADNYIYCNQSNVTIQGNTIKDNQAPGGTRGEAVAVSKSHASIENNIVHHNKTGIVFVLFSNGSILNNSIIENIDHGIFCHEGPLLIQNNLIKDNGGQLTTHGGGIHCDDISVKITGNMIIGNEAKYGAGIHCYQGGDDNDVWVVNNLIAGNIAKKRGGGVYFFNSGNRNTFHFINNTVVNNKAQGSPGINMIKSADYSTGKTTPYFVNNIIYYNRSEEKDEQIYISSENILPEFYFNNIENGILGIHRENDDFVYNKNLEILPRFADTANKDYSLLPNSPCINRGYSDTAGLNLPSNDLNGLPRIQHGQIDIGAFEADTFCSLPPIPEKPFGDTQLCKNPGITKYHTNYNETFRYHWSLYPEKAGTIVNHDTASTVEWSESYLGKAYLSVQAENDCGISEKSKLLEIFIDDVPEISNQIMGDTLWCIDSEGGTYQLMNYDNTYTYFWSLYPSKAGSVYPFRDSMAVVNWSNTYIGEAYVIVQPENHCGKGPGDSLKVRFVDSTQKATIPTGDSLVSEPSPVLYSTEKIENASYYKWFVEPSDAGKIKNAGHYAIIDWSDTFTGEAEVAVSAGNYCGLGETSDALTVQVGKPTSVQSRVQNQKNVKVYPNPTAGRLYIKTDAMIRSVAVINSQGQKTGMVRVEARQTTMDLLQYPKGLYFIEVNLDTRTGYYKVVKN